MNAERHSKNFLNKQVAPLFFLSLILIFFLQVFTKQPYLEMEDDGPD